VCVCIMKAGMDYIECLATGCQNVHTHTHIHTHQHTFSYTYTHSRCSVLTNTYTPVYPPPLHPPPPPQNPPLTHTRTLSDATANWDTQGGERLTWDNTPAHSLSHTHTLTCTHMCRRAPSTHTVSGSFSLALLVSLPQTLPCTRPRTGTHEVKIEEIRKR